MYNSRSDLSLILDHICRCADCAIGFYKQSGECIKCPDSPGMLIAGVILLVIFICAFGYFLNKHNIDIRVVSIGKSRVYKTYTLRLLTKTLSGAGVDYFQILSVFQNAKIAWPTEIKELFHVLSAFNLNIEIVAPECLVPNVR